MLSRMDCILNRMIQNPSPNPQNEKCMDSLEKKKGAEGPVVYLRSNEQDEFPGIVDSRWGNYAESPDEVISVFLGHVSVSKFQCNLISILYMKGHILYLLSEMLLITSRGYTRELKCIKNSFLLLIRSVTYCKRKCSVGSHFNRICCFFKRWKKSEDWNLHLLNGVTSSASRVKSGPTSIRHIHKWRQSISLHVAFRRWLPMCIIQFTEQNKHRYIIILRVI